MATPTLQAASSFVTGKLYLQPGERTTYKRNGIIERTSVYMSYGYPTNPPVPLYSPYPDQVTGGFVCDSTSTESMPGGFFRTTVVYVSISGQGTSYTTYETKTIQTPVDQSPNFTSMAGTPSAPINGAIFDANGRFIGFGPGIYQGVVSVFTSQRTMIIRGSSASAVNIYLAGSFFLESSTTTVRGAVVEYELVYNLSINTQGIPGVAS